MTARGQAGIPMEAKPQVLWVLRKPVLDNSRFSIIFNTCWGYLEDERSERYEAQKGEGRSMPIYEYRCKACDHVFEMLRGINDKDEEIICPACRRRGVEKLLSLFSSSGAASEGSSCGPGPFT